MLRSAMSWIWDCLAWLPCFGRQYKFQNELYEPLLEANERQAINELVYYFEDKENVDFFSGEPLRAICSLAYSDVLELQRSVAVALTEITSAPNIALTREALQPILYLLQINDVKIQTDTAAALANLSKTPANCILFIQHNGLDALISLITLSNQLQVLINAIGCLTNLSTELSLKPLIARSGVVPVLLKLAKLKDTAIQRNVAGTLLNLTHLESDRACLVHSGALSLLATLLAESTDLETLYRALTALCNIVVDSSARKRFVTKESTSLHSIVQLSRLRVPKTSDHIPEGKMQSEIHLQSVIALRNLSAEPALRLSLVQAGIVPDIALALERFPVSSDLFYSSLCVIDHLAASNTDVLVEMRIHLVLTKAFDTACGLFFANNLLESEESASFTEPNKACFALPKSRFEEVALHVMAVIKQMASLVDVAQEIVLQTSFVLRVTEILQWAFEVEQQQRRRSSMISQEAVPVDDSLENTQRSPSKELCTFPAGTASTTMEKSSSNSAVLEAAARRSSTASDLMSPTRRSYSKSRDMGSIDWTRASGTGPTYPLSVANGSLLNFPIKARVATVEHEGKSPLWTVGSPSSASILSGNSVSSGPDSSAAPLLSAPALPGNSAVASSFSAIARETAQCLTALSLSSAKVKRKLLRNSLLVTLLLDVANEQAYSLVLRRDATAILCNIITGNDSLEPLVLQWPLWKRLLISTLTLHETSRLVQLSLLIISKIAQHPDSQIAQQTICASPEFAALISDCVKLDSASRLVVPRHSYQKSDSDAFKRSRMDDHRVSGALFHSRSKSHESKMARLPGHSRGSIGHHPSSSIALPSLSVISSQRSFYSQPASSGDPHRGILTGATFPTGDLPESLLQEDIILLANDLHSFFNL